MTIQRTDLTAVSSFNYKTHGSAYFSNITSTALRTDFCEGREALNKNLHKKKKYSLPYKI